MGTYTDTCPLMNAAGVLETEAAAAVNFDPLNKPADEVDKHITAAKVQKCLKYFKWRGASQYPTAKAHFVSWNFHEVAQDVNLLPRQVKALYEEFLAYKAALETPVTPVEGGTP